jgi:hypothetical protein
MKQAGLVPDDVLNAFRKSALPGELDAIAAQARALRDWFKPFVYKHMGRPIEPNALRQLEQLNQLLARDEEFGQIVVRDRLSKEEHNHGQQEKRNSGLTWRRQRRWRSPESLLLPLARSLADLVCTENFTVKACEGRSARFSSSIELEAVRAGGAAWRCAGSAKQAAHRKRTQHARRRSD